MGIADRIPDMSEKELESLRANAERLKDSGSAIQRQQAQELLPLLGPALEEKRAERVAVQTETRRVNTEKRATARKKAKAE
ncbi:MAG: hypothetical protein IPG56_10560 [Caulobacteraceae bacterium]|jgi:hypothetical protein|nr:hypothetical protein [Caulobacteraceae bacterium]